MEEFKLQDVYKIYKEGEIETVALRGATLSISKGEFVAISGRSGSGKSTLLSILGGLTLPSAGKVIINGTEITRLTEKERAIFRLNEVGIIYQTDNLIPFLTAFENVLLPMQIAGLRNAADRARYLLNEVGLSSRMNHKPALLSGGERQRVAIAIAIANEPTLLLADELTGELDSTTAGKVMDLLARLNQSQQLTLIIVTHNQHVAALAARQINIMDGLLTEKAAING